ncbi:MAG: hypothetical protein U5K54_14505 [Cytophagales bacterium]|nr:hypothetical protein [Cytophagales bacterium]
MEKTNPDVANLFEKEHVEDHRLASVLSSLIASYKEAATAQMREEKVRSVVSLSMSLSPSIYIT